MDADNLIPPLELFNSPTVTNLNLTHLRIDSDDDRDDLLPILSLILRNSQLVHLAIFNCYQLLGDTWQPFWRAVPASLRELYVSGSGLDLDQLSNLLVALLDEAGNFRNLTHLAWYHWEPAGTAEHQWKGDRREDGYLLKEAEDRARKAMEAQQPGIQHSEDLIDVMRTAFLNNSSDVADIFDKLIDVAWQQLMDTLESIRRVMAVRRISGGGEESMLHPGWPSSIIPGKEEGLKQSERSFC